MSISIVLISRRELYTLCVGEASEWTSSASVRQHSTSLQRAVVTDASTSPAAPSATAAARRPLPPSTDQPDPYESESAAVGTASRPEDPRSARPTAATPGVRASPARTKQLVGLISVRRSVLASNSNLFAGYPNKSVCRRDRAGHYQTTVSLP